MHLDILSSFSRLGESSVEFFIDDLKPDRRERSEKEQSV